MAHACENVNPRCLASLRADLKDPLKNAQTRCSQIFLSVARLLLRHNCNKGIIVARRMGNLALDGVLAAVYVACSIYFNARAMLPFRA